MNYYELLEISPSASIEVIRNAYKTLAKKYHPDTYRGDGAFAEEKMKLLNEAVSVLEDEDKRSEYNKINGINPLSKSGYSEYGRSNMINVDENGEPIFFSYDIDDSDDYDKPDGDNSFMDVIDEFIKNSREEQAPAPKTRPKKKQPKKSESETIPDDVIENIVADISKANAKKFGNGEIGFNYVPPADPVNTTYSAVLPDDAEEEEEDEDISGEPVIKVKSYADRIKIYYIVLICFVLAIIFLFVMISRKTDFGAIRDLFSSFSGGQDNTTEKQPGEEKAGVSETEDIDDHPPINPLENTTEDTPEETSEEPTTDELAGLLPEPTTVQPATEPPATTEEPTEAPTEELTEEPTEEAPAEETTEEPAGETTEEVTEEPTEETTEESAEAPTEEATEETTEAPTEPEAETQPIPEYEEPPSGDE